MNRNFSMTSEHKNGEWVRVQLFAAARERVGLKTVNLPINPHTTTRNLLQMLHALHPELRKVSGRLAVNEEFIENDCHVHAGDEVAFIPPVSGG
jgi:sulfur-carrier protein